MLMFIKGSCVSRTLTDLELLDTFEKLRDLCFFCIGRRPANLVKTKLRDLCFFYARLFSVECLPHIPSGGQDQKKSI
jgi:hypothetical protein